MKQQFELHFSGLAEPISRQLKKQGLFINNEKRYNKIARAITLLYIHGLINESERSQLIRKFGVMIEDEIQPIQPWRGEINVYTRT